MITDVLPALILNSTNVMSAIGKPKMLRFMATTINVLCIILQTFPQNYSELIHIFGKFKRKLEFETLDGSGLLKNSV